jgi:hypothetical protein
MTAENEDDARRTAIMNDRLLESVRTKGSVSLADARSALIFALPAVLALPTGDVNDLARSALHEFLMAFGGMDHGEADLSVSSDTSLD